MAIFDITYIGDLPFLKLTGGQVTGATTFDDLVTIDEASVGDLTVTGSASITNNLQVGTINNGQPITGSGTSGYLTKFNGSNTITNGPQLGSSIDTFLRNDGSWGAVKISVTETLNAEDWSDNTQTITVSGVTANNDVFISPAPSSIDSFSSAGILCVAQDTNSLTFECSSTPDEAVDVNLLILV